MAELGVAGCIGTACVQQQYVTPEMVRALSKTIFTVLLPMFIGTNILKTVTAASSSGGGGGVKRSAFILVPLLALSQSAILLWITSKVLLPLMFAEDKDFPSSDLGRTLTVTCSFGNAGVLPFIFADALFRDNAALLQRALSYVSLFSVGWSPFFWSFGKKILVGDTDNSNSSSSGSSWKKQLSVFLPPPVMGVAIGLFLGLTPLGPLLFRGSSGQTSNTNTALLSVVFTSIQNLGKTASPLALLVLTCSLAMGAKKKKITTDDDSTIVIGPVRKW
eukprot:CAMPEP_0194264582 /NCGR_PEP_ID=MMETSP0158-20130606/47662_1 /TAXON_ID=33649 /ORGANISM="Thalassionema nitzschioides, Strain L26-B" /LENGTH=275 /DNA_ID=CAMNT_0039004827 /DNA_START=162 /DNA_END=986 /DNA_ORIENTATION=-